MVFSTVEALKIISEMFISFDVEKKKSYRSYSLLKAYDDTFPNRAFELVEKYWWDENAAILLRITRLLKIKRKKIAKLAKTENFQVYNKMIFFRVSFFAR